jgi:heme/copper-type cytochrome/quinol oxidase subunit 1
MVFTIALVAVSLSMIALPFLTNVVHLGPSSMPIRKIPTFLWTRILA